MKFYDRSSTSQSFLLVTKKKGLNIKNDYELNANRMVQYLFANWVVHIATFFFSRTKNQSQSLFCDYYFVKSQLLCTPLRSSGAQKLKQSKAKQASKQAPITVSLKDTQKGWKKAQILVTKSLTCFFLFLILLPNGQTLFCTPLEEWKKSPSPAISSRKLTMLLKKEGKEKKRK
jgi:hypothetical protein